MKKLISIILLLFVGFTFSQNTLTFDEKSVDQSTVFDLPIKIKNDNAFTAIQFDLNFNKDAFSLDSEHALGSIAENHSLSVSNPSDGVIRVVIYSGENKEIASSDATLVTIKLKSKTLPGIHAIEINSIVASDTSKNTVSFNGDTKNITVNGSILAFQNSTIDYGRVPMKSSSSQSLTISNNGTTDLVLNSNNDVSPFSLSASYPVTISAGNSVSLTINLDTETKDTFEKKLKFDSNDQDPLRKIQEVTLKAIVFGVNELYIGSGSGNINEEIVIPVRIKNQEEFTGFQFDIPLPNNIEYVENSISDKGRGSDHTYSASVINTSTLRIISYSSTNSNFNGNDGEVLSFKFKPNVNSGWYSLNPNGIIITNKISENIFSDSYSGNIQVNSPSIFINPSSINYGDIPINVNTTKQLIIKNNGQSTLNISNIYSNKTDFVLDKTTLSIQPNNQETLTISYQPTTLGSISTNIIIEHNDPNKTSVVNLTGNVFSPNYVKAKDQDFYVGNNILNIELINRDEVKALQFDFTLPSGFTSSVDDLSINSQLNDFTASKSLIDGKFRVIIYSVNSTLINSNENPVILNINTIVSHTANKGISEINFSDIIISGSENNNIASNILDKGKWTLLNSAPTASDINVKSADNTSKEITLLGSDIDHDDLTYTLFSEPSSGTVSLSGNIATYKSNENFEGTDTFTYKVNDGELDSNSATVTINVTNTNDAPTASDINTSTDEDSSVDITLEGSDVDQDDLTYSIVTQASNGTLSVNGAVVTYTPNDNYNGTDTFTYKVNDGTVDSNTATVTITVNPVNDTPTASNVDVSTDEDKAVEFRLVASDNDGDDLTYSVVTEPSNGVVSINGSSATSPLMITITEPILLPIRLMMAQ